MIDEIEQIGDDPLALPPEAEARLRELQAAQNERRAAARTERAAKRALWRTHHWVDEYDRCTVVAGRHVCRRCATLYPIAFAVVLGATAGLAPWPTRYDLLFIWVLCIPATLEFLAEKLLDVAYSPRRQVAVTALVGLALGRGLHYELDDRWSWRFWGPVLVFGTIWFLAAMAAFQRSMMARALDESLEFGPGRAEAAEDADGPG